MFLLAIRALSDRCTIRLFFCYASKADRRDRSGNTDTKLDLQLGKGKSLTIEGKRSLPEPKKVDCLPGIDSIMSQNTSAQRNGKFKLFAISFTNSCLLRNSCDIKTARSQKCSNQRRHILICVKCHQNGHNVSKVAFTDGCTNSFGT